MKETKTFLLLFVSILLLAVSVTLLWSWGSQFRQLSVQAKRSVPAAEAVERQPVKTKSDTLKEVFRTALVQLDKSIDSVWNSASSVKEDLAIKLASFYKLRTEITALFNEEQTAENIHLARIKIMELQDKVHELNLTNSDIERENRRLTSLLKSMNAAPLPVATSISASFSRGNEEEVTATGPLLIASDIQFSAIAEPGNSELQSSPMEAASLTGSFQVRSKGELPRPEDVMVVVLQPDGKVLQKSTWESGSFETQAGKKIYSCKVIVEPLNGEARKFQFSINSANLQKGNYTIQLYHKGKMIGNARRTLG